MGILPRDSKNTWLCHSGAATLDEVFAFWGTWLGNESAYLCVAGIGKFLEITWAESSNSAQFSRLSVSEPVLPGG